MSTIALLSLGTVMMSPPPLPPSPQLWPLPQKRTVGETVGTLAAEFKFTCDQPAVPVLTRAFTRYTKLCVRGRVYGHELAGNTNVLEALDVRVSSSDANLDLETVCFFLHFQQAYADVWKWSHANEYPPALRRRTITR